MSKEEMRREWNEKVIRAWTDDEYRASLTDEERALIPENPAGQRELSEAELGHVAGGTGKGCGCAFTKAGQD